MQAPSTIASGNAGNTTNSGRRHLKLDRINTNSQHQITSAVIALVYLSSNSLARKPTSQQEWQEWQEWQDDDGDYGADDEEAEDGQIHSTSTQHSRSNPPPAFPYLAYAISHPNQDGSIETLRRHGLPIPKWATYPSSSPSSSSSSSASSHSSDSSNLNHLPHLQSQHTLSPRRLIISNSDTVLFPGTETPLSPVLLILVPLGISAVFLIYALVCLYTTRGPLFSSATSRKVMDERARAKTELRLRGAGGYRPPGGVSPDGSSIGHHTTNQRSAGSSRVASSTYDQKTLGLGIGNDGETSSAGSSSSGLAGNGGGRPSKVPSGPRHPRSGRHAQQPSAASLLDIPTLTHTSGTNRSHNSRSAGTGHYAGRSAVPPSSYAGGAPLNQTISGSSQKNRISTSVGRGTDLGRTRSLKREISRTSNDQMPIGSGRKSENSNRYGNDDPLTSTTSPRRNPIPVPQRPSQPTRPTAGPRRPTGNNVHRSKPSASSFHQQTQQLYGQAPFQHKSSNSNPYSNNNRNSTLSIGDNPLDIDSPPLSSSDHSARNAYFQASANLANQPPILPTHQNSRPGQPTRNPYPSYPADPNLTSTSNNTKGSWIYK